jgi:hypothetical protein
MGVDRRKHWGSDRSRAAEGTADRRAPAGKAGARGRLQQMRRAGLSSPAPPSPGLESSQASSTRSGNPWPPPHHLSDGRSPRGLRTWQSRRGLRPLAFQVSVTRSASGLSSLPWSADRDIHATAKQQNTAAIRYDAPLDYGMQTTSSCRRFDGSQKCSGRHDPCLQRHLPHTPSVRSAVTRSAESAASTASCSAARAAHSTGATRPFQHVELRPLDPSLRPAVLRRPTHKWVVPSSQPALAVRVRCRCASLRTRAPVL